MNCPLVKKLIDRHNEKKLNRDLQNYEKVYGNYHSISMQYFARQ